MGGLAQTALATENATEAMADRASGSVLVVDELKHLDGKGVLKLIYTIAGGAGKARLTREAVARPRRQWNVFALLSSEVGLRNSVMRDGGSWPGGAAARLADVALVGTKEAPEVFSAIKGIDHHFGRAGPAFVEALIADGAHLETDALKEMLRTSTAALAGDEANGALERAATPFALMWAAGLLARRFKLIPEKADVDRAVKQAWAMFRGSSSAAVLAPVEEAIRMLRDGIASTWDRTIVSIDNPNGTRDAIGWHNADAVYVLKDHLARLAGNVLPEADLARALDERGLLVGRKTDRKRRLVYFVPGVGRVAAYALDTNAFGKGSRGDA